MLTILSITRIGNPVLRQIAKALSPEKIRSEAIQLLIANMRYTLVEKEYGVGLAAPQVGRAWL